MGAKSGRNKRGAKKTSAPKAGKGIGGASRPQTIGLILFAVFAVGIFVVFWVADGIGSPSVPSGDVATISNAPTVESHDYGTITEAAYKKSLEQQETQAGLKKAPKPGSKKAEEIQQKALGELLQSSWIFGEAEELGIKVTKKEREAELAKVKKESFKTEKAFQEFLKESHLTPEEVNQRIELQILTGKIQEKITKEAPKATEAEQEEYYEENKATQFTKKPTRDVRVVVNENKKEVDAALKALEADNSAKSWEKVTEKYSPTTSANGGLQKEISEEFLTEPLKKDIFQSEEGELIGPVKQEKNYLLLEVVKSHPEKVQSFAEVKTTVSTTLDQQKEQSFFSEWVRNFQTKWTARSRCASGFASEQCANYPAADVLAKSREAYKACYEANPKKPATECPAPVPSTKPVEPGTVTKQEPEGVSEGEERKPQGPIPYTPKGAKGKKAAEEAAAGAAGATGTEGAEASPEQEAAAQKAVEEAAAQAAAESQANGKEPGGKKSGK